MKIPLTSLEIRHQEDYTHDLVSALTAQVSGDGVAAAVAAVETAAGWWGRAFASAAVEPDTPATRALTPAVRELIGRSLLLDGEAVFEIVTDPREGLTLVPADSWDIQGSGRWTYLLAIPSPTDTVHRRVSELRVVHPRIGVTKKAPWRGVGPLDGAGVTTKLLAALENSLAREANTPHGYALPVPDPKNTTLRNLIRDLKGKSMLVESTVGNWGMAEAQRSAYRTDWEPRRLGFNPPQTLDGLRGSVQQSILAAAGVPGGVLSQVDGTAHRELLRQFLHTTIAPISQIVADELATKLDVPGLMFNFDKLFASDLSGRARAFQSMVGGGMDVDKAAALAGLMVPDAA